MSRSAIPRALIIEREKKVWDMRVKGATYERIAEEIGITFGGVKNILERLHKRYRDAHMDDVEACRLEQIAELTHIADEAKQAWERSKKTKVIVKKQARQKDGSFAPGQVTEEKYEQEGDPRYLQVYMKAKEDLRKIMGADAPIKIKRENDDAKKELEEIRLQMDEKNKKEY